VTTLSHLTVLAIDCQATRSNPSSGHLVEIGWAKTQAASLFDHEKITETAKSYLVSLESDAQMTPKFLSMTGIEPAEMMQAVPQKEAWHKLWQESKKTKADNQGICPAVIHFKRYEEPYLRQLHREFDSQKKFPFTILCTHDIFSRLYPGLPRKSLRAAAGFFGYSLPNLRRSLPHVVATAFIWKQIVSILEEKEKVFTIEDLRDWLCHPASPGPCKRSNREYPMAKSARKDIPDKPGIYKMYRSSGELLYIGKAKSLKHRVNSYFHLRGRHAEHILEMLSQAQNLTTTVTGTAFEAAVRESDEIKLYSPPYNRALQPNERQIFFYSANFKNKRKKPDCHHPLGPFPSNIDMESLAKFIDILNRKNQNLSPKLIETILGTPPGYAPDKDCFREGLEDFKIAYGQKTQRPFHLAHIRVWGTRFWKEKLMEKEKERQKKSALDAEISAEDEEKEKKENTWTPERVSKALKRLVRIGSFQMRRARWFCRLSESNLTWTNTHDSLDEKHVLVIENGIPFFREGYLSLSLTTPPTGHQKSRPERQKNFDIAAYDRMRIVTTEMRRIVLECQDIELCFHPGAILRSTELEKILRWV